MNKLLLTTRGFAKTLRLANINRLVGINAENKLQTFEKVDLFIENGKIKEIKPSSGAKEAEGVKTIDTNGALVTPAFVDPHTHIFPPKDRAHEFAMRSTHTYEQIAQSGGGISHSVKACREASFDEIYKVNEQIVRRFIAQGTLTLEIKSGYGLDTKTEIKLLNVIKALKQNYKKFIEIVPTFMGAHDFPPEFKNDRQGYVNLIVDEMLPAISKENKLAEFCDVFCENGWFTPEDTRVIMKAAKKHKLKVRVHADEFQDSQAATTAVKLRAYAADHLMAVSSKGIQSLAKKNSITVATILPGTTVFLGLKQFAPAREMIDQGIEVAIGTDFNPGSCAFNSQALMMNLAIANCKLSLEEAFNGVTKTAAKSLRRNKVGYIGEGAKADLLVWNLESLEQIPYYSTESASKIDLFLKNGKPFTLKKVEKVGLVKAQKPKQEKPKDEKAKK